jgi:hypothetical protein
MIYKHLKPGDIRQVGDEQRQSDLGDYHPCHRVGTPRPNRPGEWRSVPLIGHAILASDLMHLNFRRPCKTQ